MKSTATAIRAKTDKVIPFRREEFQFDFFIHQKPASKVLLFEPIKWTDDEMDTLRDRLLEKSLADLVKGRKYRGVSYYQEVLDWVMSDSEHPFSFNVCCTQAGFYPHLVREAVLDQIN